MGEVDVVFGIHIFFEIGKGHYYEINFFNLLNFYPVTRFLVTPLLVTRYCVTLFSNTRFESMIWPSIRFDILK